jgi:kinesin family protein 11
MICVQNLVELQELYNSQQLLTAELSVKLEKTEVRIGVCSHFILLFWTFDLL